MLRSMTQTPDIKPRSRDVTDGLEKAAARGMLRAVGLSDEDFAKPQIGVASSWNEITPCNLSLARLAQAQAGRAVEAARVGAEEVNGAITASTLALASEPAHARIPLDTVITTMWQTAQDMNVKYKETAEGGLALQIAVNVAEC